MSNTKRGLVVIEIGGVEKTLRFPMSVMRVLQERFDTKSPLEVWGGVAKWSAEDYCEVFLLGLRKGSDPDITLEEVEDMLEGTEIPYYQASILDVLNSSLDGRNLSERTNAIYDKAIGNAQEKAAKAAEKEDPTENGTGTST